jgi:hypothetical protein
MAQTQTPVPSVSLQGVLVPQTSIQPEAFFRATQRLNVRQQTFAWGGFGTTQNVPILQTGIVSKLRVKFAGTLTVTLGGGTAATTMGWPYNLIKRIRFSANGQSNLINASGWQLKARQFMERSDCNDRGVPKSIGGTGAGTARTQGTLSLNNENWGVGQGTTALVGAPTVYDVDLEWEIPVSFDQVFLHGAIFAQTSSTDLNLALDMAAQAELFTLTGAATAVLAGAFVVEAVLFTIPQGPDGSVLVPDLSMFHSVIGSRFAGPTVGTNEVRLAGQGVGRQLMRLWFQTLNGAGSVPLAVNDVNYGQIGWRYGGNDTPEVWQDGWMVAQVNESLFGSDFASQQGFAILDWSSEHALRDTIDEGSATELRILVEIANGVVLTTPAIEYVQETMFSGAVGA